jgi:hypothetical protein
MCLIVLCFLSLCYMCIYMFDCYSMYMLFANKEFSHSFIQGWMIRAITGNVQVYKYSAKNSNMLAKNAYVQIYMQDKLTQNDIRFQQHSYCNTNINVILLGYCYCSLLFVIVLHVYISV